MTSSLDIYGNAELVKHSMEKLAKKTESDVKSSMVGGSPLCSASYYLSVMGSIQ